jgi:hypothetical protein
METTAVFGENRSIWGETGEFRENRVYGDNGSIWRKQEYLGGNAVFSRYSRCLHILCFL